MIRLLSTDFDGTLVEHEGQPPVAPALYRAFDSLQKHGVIWALNTGRDLPYALEGLREYGFPIVPDFILTNEREIYHQNSRGEWQAYGDWNQRCTEAHDALFEKEKEFLHNMIHFARSETRSEIIHENDRPVGIIASTEEEVDRFLVHLHDQRHPESLFHYQRNTIYLRFCHLHYSKGTTLSELGRLTGVSPEEIFAAGDHHNDLSMLDGIHARWTAAPKNAHPEIKETVLKAGGYVSEESCSHGVLEALKFFFEEHQQGPCDFSI